MKRIVIILIIIIFPLKVGAISASSYIVMDTDNNRILEGNNINKESLIASIAKCKDDFLPFWNQSWGVPSIIIRIPLCGESSLFFN